MCGVKLVDKKNAKGADRHVEVEGISRKAGKSKWCEVVWSCLRRPDEDVLMRQ